MSNPTEKLSRAEVLSRLRELEKLKTGDRVPIWLSETYWGKGLSKLAGRAADLLEGKE